MVLGKRLSLATSFYIKNRRNIYKYYFIIRDMKKVLNGFLLLLLAFTFSLVLISAQTPADFTDPIKDLFANWESGNLSVNIAKYLFLLLITLFVWSILDFSGLFPSKLVEWIVAIIVAFLSVAYIAPNELWTLLTSYKGLGLTLMFVVPLVILVLFTLRIAAVGGARGILAQYLIWIVYLLFLVGAFITGILTNKIKVSDPFAWIYIAAISIVALFVIFNRLLIRWLGKEELEAESAAAENTLKKAVRLRRMEAKALEEQSK